MFNTAEIFGLALFGSAMSVLLYVYVGYPLLLAVITRWNVRPRSSAAITPTVSVIIAAYNEEKIIREKIDNTLSCDYPSELLEVVVISDGSTDRTNSLVQEMRDERIKFCSYLPRRGKAYALNQAAGIAKGEVFVFSDANVLYEKAAIRRLTSNFADPSVGAVCGKVLLGSLHDEGTEPVGEGLYMRYEGLIQEMEGKLHTMIGTDGAMYAIRGKLFERLPENTILDDFVTAMRVLKHGRRIVYETEAQGIELVAPSVRKEYTRKVRMIAGGYQSLALLRFVLNPFRFPLVAFQFVSHKLLRWFSPFLLASAFFSNLFLLQVPGFRVLFAIQSTFYGCAITGFSSETLRKFKIFYIPYYFCSSNVAAAHGLWRYLLSHQGVTWEKARP